MGIQFTPDWIPLDFQPFNQTFSLNGGTAHGDLEKGVKGARPLSWRTSLFAAHCKMQQQLDTLVEFEYVVA